MEGDAADAIAELEILKEKPDLSLACYMALVLAHKKCPQVGIACATYIH